MEKTNTQNYNTKHSKLIDYENFVPEKEKEELKKLKRQKLKNPEGIYNLPNNTQKKFNKVTKTMQDLSGDEIEDNIEAIDKLEETIKKFNEFDK